jgi:imidazolonepropionase
MPHEPLLLTGTGRLLTGRGVISPWAMELRDGVIAWIGSSADAPRDGHLIDLGPALVTPGLIDAHTHPVYAGDRSDEAAARLAGAAYDGGGILRTVRATRDASDDELLMLIEGRLRTALGDGTTTIECKSGYGLSTADELRALRLIGAAAQRVGMRVVRTFLGAHAVPPGFTPDAYVDLIVEEMLPAVASEADFCDVFCDRGFFSVAQAERILRAAGSHGLGLRMHAEQLARTGAVEMAVGLGVTSVDHLEQLDPSGVAALAGSSTVATLLPGPALVMRDSLPPARALLDAGVRVALASDANAGTFGSCSMPLVIGLGATLLGMSVDEALTAATLGGAASLGLGEICGELRPGLAADLVAWDAEHEGAFALHLGGVRPRQIWVGGAPLLGESPGD